MKSGEVDLSTLNIKWKGTTFVGRKPAWHLLADRVALAGIVQFECVSGSLVNSA